MQISAFGQQAKFIAKYFKGGQRVIISAEIKGYVSEIEGKNVSHNSLIVRDIQHRDKKEA